MEKPMHLLSAEYGFDLPLEPHHWPAANGHLPLPGCAHSPMGERRLEEEGPAVIALEFAVQGHL